MKKIGTPQRFLITSIGQAFELGEGAKYEEPTSLLRQGRLFNRDRSQLAIHQVRSGEFLVGIGQAEFNFYPNPLSSTRPASMKKTKRLKPNADTGFCSFDYVFIPHRSNWLSNLDIYTHEPLFRFLFSSRQQWKSVSELNAPPVFLTDNVDTALGQFIERLTAILGPNQTSLFSDSIEENAIVVQNSPPVLTSLKDLLASSNGVAIGGFIGGAASLENLPLMLLTVPLGMVVVSASVGVSQALQHGLRERTAALIAGRVDTATDASNEEDLDQSERST